MKGKCPSPLRYPGGKTALADILQSILYRNALQGCTLIEPFAGGAGASLYLLDAGHVDRIIINDADPSIFAFWRSITRNTDRFIEKILNVDLTIDEWRKQKAIYSSPRGASQFELGFSTFYLNRCNRSGIIKSGGPIGGILQVGEWKIDARFNRENLAERIRDIASFGERIAVLGLDAVRLIGDLDNLCGVGKRLVFADPPYYVKGQELYLNHYEDSDHLRFSQVLRHSKSFPWVLTYDNVHRIRELYRGLKMFHYKLRYSAHHSSPQGAELFIASDDIEVSDSLSLALPTWEVNQISTKEE